MSVPLRELSTDKSRDMHTLGSSLHSSSKVFDSPEEDLQKEAREREQAASSGLETFFYCSSDIANPSGIEIYKTPTLVESEKPEKVQKSLEQRPKNALLVEIRGFSKLQDGWDGPDSKAPKADSIEDAYVIANAWPKDLPLPVPDVDFDGNVCLDLIGEDGFAIAGFDFSGEENRAAYSIINGEEVCDSGVVDTTSTTEYLNVFKKIAERVG